MSAAPKVNERIAARRAEVRAERRRGRLRRTLVVTALVLVVAAAVALERSSLVALASFEVEGVERLTVAEVQQAADVELGTSVLRIRTGAMRERVEALPLVERASVERDGPVGLVVTIEEVAPALTAVYGEQPVLVDQAGLVLGPGRAPGTPVVRVPGAPPVAGDTVAEHELLALGHEVVLGLPTPLLSLVERATVDAERGLRLLLVGGETVRWGDGTRPDEKARALGAVLEDLDGRKVTAIDVRAPAAPTVVP